MNDVTHKPMCILLFSIIIIIYCFYITGAIKTLPCEKNFTSIISSNFVHIDYLHLLSNLYGIYAISRVEIKLGTIKFIILLLLMISLNTMFEIILCNIFPNQIKCSIGFSGILYGVLMFEIIVQNNLDYRLLSSLITSAILPSAVNRKISLSGHIIGLLTGSLLGISYNTLFYNDDSFICNAS